MTTKCPGSTARMSASTEAVAYIRRIATFDSVSASAESPLLKANHKDSPKASLEYLFSNRPSLLDVKQLATEHAQSTNLTGFYHFYWVILTFFVISTFFVNWVETGSILSGILMEICFSDALGVIFGEALFLVAVLSAGLFVFLDQGFFRYISNIIPWSVLVLGSYFGFYRNWSGLQRAIYLLHSLSVFMKVYAFLYHHRTLKVPINLFYSKLSNLFYFVFAPTMIYSESYPKIDRYNLSLYTYIVITH